MTTLRARLATLEKRRAATRTDRRAADALGSIRSDPANLFRLAAVDPDPWQADLIRRLPARTLALCCRQSGKSTTAAACCLRTALLEPGSLTLILSPTLRQSAELYRKAVALYRACGRPVPAVTLNRTGLELANGSRILALPGDPAGIVGFSAPRLVVLDEAARCSDELYLSVRPMLAVGGGRLLCCSTPFGARGFLYEAWANGDGWERVRVPATGCPRIRPEFLAEERLALGARWFGQEYELNFVDAVGQVFETADILAAGVNEAPFFPLAA